mgnify:FL=1
MIIFGKEGITLTACNSNPAESDWMIDLVTF